MEDLLVKVHECVELCMMWHSAARCIAVWVEDVQGVAEVVGEVAFGGEGDMG